MQENSAAAKDFNANIPNHLLLGVMTTLFCCLPFGIVSIIYAIQVNTALAAGNSEMAMRLSEKAKFWGVVSIAVGVAVNLISLFFFLLSGTASLTMTQQL